MIVTAPRQLEELCDKLRDAGSFGVDTEFVRERTYFIRLGIMQVACPDVEAILDPQSLESLDPFYTLICEPGVEKVVHAGEQDFFVMFERAGKPPRNVFDTQIAAALVGYGEQLAYAKLVQKVTNVRLSKLETLTDWTVRPLSRAQISYALDDVRHLPALRSHLGKRLEEMGRVEWAKEEFHYLEQPETYRLPEPHEFYERIRSGGMDGRHLGVLRELAAWREQEARRRDIPRGWIIRDQSLVEMARKVPTSINELRRIRSIKIQELERSGDHLLEMIRRGAENPVSDSASKAPPTRVKSRAKPLIRLLDAWLHARAVSAKIAPSIVASKDQLRAMVEGHLQGSVPDVPVLSGWRRDLVGSELLDILSGKLRLRVKSQTGKLLVEQSSGGAES
jgi:ribonuclease D